MIFKRLQRRRRRRRGRENENNKMRSFGLRDWDQSMAAGASLPKKLKMEWILYESYVLAWRCFGGGGGDQCYTYQVSHRIKDFRLTTKPTTGAALLFFVGEWTRNRTTLLLRRAFLSIEVDATTDVTRTTRSQSVARLVGNLCLDRNERKTDDVMACPYYAKNWNCIQKFVFGDAHEPDSRHLCTRRAFR